MPVAVKLRADAKRNRERVFEAAKDAFAEQGADTSMDDIARRAGVGVGTLYRAFGSRSGLVEALYADAIERLEVGAVRLAAAADPWLALTAWLQDYVMALTSKRTMLIELMPLFQQHPSVLEQSRRRAADALDLLLRSAQASGYVRPDLEAQDLIRLVNGVLGAGAGDGGRTDVMLTIVLNGIRARETAR